MNYFYDPHKPLDISTGRDLPHWQQDGKISFITFRLADSLPRQVLTEMEKEIKNGDPTIKLERRKIQTLFKYMDAGYGSCILSELSVRKIMEKVIMYGNDLNFELYAAVIMPNHVHILLRPYFGVDVQSVVTDMKRISSHLINRALGINGPLWQRESFDRLIRNNESFLRTIQYISDNPSHCLANCASLYDPSTHSWHSAP